MARRGPNTERGKAAARVNAVKHGLRSNAPVIPELESFEDWDRHRAAIVASWEPKGGFENFLKREKFDTSFISPEKPAAAAAVGGVVVGAAK